MPTYLDVHAREVADALGVHASITLRHHGATVRVASSSDRAALCDQAEARSEDGPCIVAMSSLRAVTIPDLAAERRWPAWSRTTRDAGFTAVVAVPASVEPTTAVALNLYLDPGRTWTQQDAAHARARVTSLAEDVIDRLAAAATLPAVPAADEELGTAGRIDQAVGVLMQANGCDARTARALLDLVAARHDRDVADVAAFLITAVGGRL
ncbi:ANTAR domain-containing protein [Cellulomonas sp. IC4_254]|uniref:ANTAR domain-containing protein n=1 Tax=Cellulomonas sp. IC4_254 TaxID=2714040 RepID=UPI00142025FE|nr:ANTAR domain-containing protein [Cellulomonas sp. IC4_254]NHT17544.1 GAF and ANTAR domain-containing protein [Cellulomonas sp. IC4_254]